MLNPAERQLRMGAQQPPVHVDETPWPVLGVKEWREPEKFCLFHAGDTRTRVLS